MSLTLYRKYRPQTFADVVDQQHVRLTLQNALEHDRVAHAYIFAGPRGVGKTTIARLLARAINCQNRGKDGEPCNTCPTCSAMLSNSSLDVVEVDAASQTGVDNVRDNIIQSARTAPAIGKYKVFIIDEVHMLSLAAFNALLKVIEEPPAHAIFILATTDIHRVPETIISRTQRFDFKKFSLSDIVGRLMFLAQQEKKNVDPIVAERIARAAGGSLRDAESMLGQLFTFDQRDVDQELADLVLPRSDQATVLKIMSGIANGQTKEALDAFHQFCDNGGDIPTLVHDLVRSSRVMLLLSVDAKLMSDVLDDVDQSTAQELQAIGQRIGSNRCVTATESWLQAERRLHRAAVEELPVEIAIIEQTISSDRIDQAPPAPPSAPATVQTKPQSAPTVKPTKAAPRRSTGALPLAEIQAAWQKLKSSIGREHPSIGLSIQHADVTEAEDDTVVIRVPFKLHADRLSDPKFQQVIHQKLADVINQPFKLRIELGESVPDAPAPVETTAPTTTAAPKGDLWDHVVGSFS